MQFYAVVVYSDGCDSGWRLIQIRVVVFVLDNWDSGGVLEFQIKNPIHHRLRGELFDEENVQG